MRFLEEWKLQDGVGLGKKKKEVVEEEEKEEREKKSEFFRKRKEEEKTIKDGRTGKIRRENTKCPVAAGTANAPLNLHSHFL